MSLYRWPSFPLESSFFWLSSSCHTGSGSPRRLNHYESKRILSATALKGLGSSMLPVDALKTSYRPLHEADVTNGVAGHDVSIPLLEKFSNASLSPEVGSSQPADSASTCRGVSSSESSMGLEIDDRKIYGLLHDIFFHLSPMWRRREQHMERNSLQLVAATGSQHTCPYVSGLGGSM